MKKLNAWCMAAVLATLSQVSQAQILVGQTAGFTGPVGAGVKETTEGARLYIDAVNARGGVNGQKIELISLDDNFDPKQAGDISPATLEGFAAAKVLVEGLRRAGASPTRDKIQTALEGMRKFDIGGLEVSYSPDDHTGLEFADLSIIGTDGKFKR